MEKKVLISFIAIFTTFMIALIIMSQAPLGDSSSAQEKPIPEYAKWGSLAMEKVKEKYPIAEIIDYLHIGREVGRECSVEKFKLWLRDSNQKEFGVYVHIIFDNQTEEIINVKYIETNR